MTRCDLGFVGAGQLARMAAEAASALGLSVAVLAEHPGDAACEVAAEVVLGSPFEARDLRHFAERCDVVTFDHEQVDLELVAALSEAGAVVRPGAASLELAVDKGVMRSVLDEAGVPVPAVPRSPKGRTRRRSSRPSPGTTGGRSSSSRRGGATTARESGRWSTGRRLPRCCPW